MLATSKTPERARLKRIAQRGDQNPPRFVLPQGHAPRAAQPDHERQAGRRQGQGPPQQGRQARWPTTIWTASPASTGARFRSTKVDREVLQQKKLCGPRRHRAGPGRALAATRSIACTKGDELPPGVIKMVKVYIAMRRKLAGRRQDGRSSRQQGRRQPDSSGRGHALLCRTAHRSTSF